MKQWFRVACLAAGAGLAFGSMAQTEPAAGPRPGTVVDIKPNRIYLLDVERAGERLVAVGERGFTLVSDDSGQTWKAVGTPVVVFSFSLPAMSTVRLAISNWPCMPTVRFRLVSRPSTRATGRWRTSSSVEGC